MNKLGKKIKTNRGMTYVELIVVLSIFAILSAVIIFNYNNFQSKVDLKSLASDIALQVLQAQKSSINGILPKQFAGDSTWKPSYGVYFDSTNPTKFIYFVDLDNSGGCTGSGCWPYSVGGEVLDVINITKGNKISAISLTGAGNCAGATGFSAIFTRPDSSAKMGGNIAGCTSQVSYAEITLLAPNGTTAKVKIYSSGRVQIN